MTPEIAFMLAFVLVALLLFALELFPIEVTAFSMLACLLVFDFVSLDQALAGLSNKAVVTIATMFLLSHSLVKTGILEVAADRLSHRVKGRPWLGVAILLAITGVLSGFLHNTAVVAVFIPVAISLCHSFHLSPSKVLIPLSYVSIIGGTLTLIGTSTNLIVSSVAEAAGHPPLGMFEFFGLGSVLLLVGFLYLVFLAPRGLPARSSTASLTGKYQMGRYLTEVQVLDESPLVGRTCREASLNERYDITVLAILRGGVRRTENIRNRKLQAKDMLIVRGAVESFLQLRREQGLAMLPDIKLNDRELTHEGQVMAEGLVTRNSSLIGRTLKEIDFRQHYRAFVLAIHHHGEILRRKISHIPISFSDTLLMVTSPDRVAELRQSEDLIIISEVDLQIRKGRLWWLVLVLIPSIVLLAALGWTDILTGALLAVALLFVLRNLSPREAYRSVDWSVILLIAGLIPVGTALVETGTASFLADQILGLVSLLQNRDLAPYLALSLVYLVTSLLTQVISNAATAVLMPPVALSLASALDVDPRPFLMATCFGASAAFATPMGYQTNLMVYAPGKYRFLDYVRFGGPLNLVFWLVASVLIPWIWPF